MASRKIKKKTAIPGSSRRRSWVAVGTLAAYSATGIGRVATAQQTRKSADLSKPSQRIEALPVRRYAVPGGSLSDCIPLFEKTSGLAITTASPDILTVRTEGIKDGVYTVEQALGALVANTGLQYRFKSGSVVLLELKTASATVEVTDAAPVLSGSIPKYQIPLNDTPQTVNVVSSEVMAEQGTTTLRDALRNVAGISLAAGEGGSQGDNLSIRGFTARNDLFIDGMRDFGSYYRDPFNTAEVEVLQGPSSVTFGRGSTGGVVNQESKTAGLTRFMTAGLMFGTDATKRATLDIDVPVPVLGQGAAFRLNAMGNIGGFAGRDVAEVRRDGFAPSLSLGLGTPTRLTFSFFHQNADDVPDYGIPWLFNGPAPVNRSNYYGLAKDNFLRTYDDIGTAKIEHDVNAHFTLRDQFRYANYVRDAVITEGQLTGLQLNTPLDTAKVTRNEIAVNSTETYLDEQFDGIAHFKTGSLEQTLVSGIEAGRETSDPTRPKYTAPQTSLFHPDPSQRLNGSSGITSSVNDSAVSLSAYVLDTVRAGRHWEFTGGLRFDRFDNSYLQKVAPVRSLERVDQKPTWRVAATYHPLPAASIYFAAGTSFNPSAETLSLSAATVDLAPETNKTYEFGSKWDLSRGHLSINNSWFRTTKDNAREPSPTNPLLSVLAGVQRVDGVELDLKAQVMSRWDMQASYAYLDSRVVSSNYYPKAIGYPLANVPRNTFAYWSHYRLPHHVDLGAGTNYVSSRNASSTVPLDPVTGLVRRVPGYWVFNAMAEYPINERVTMQVNGYNLANRYYYDELHPAHIVIGAGRSATIGFKFNF